jgi:hypothetical protein
MILSTLLFVMAGLVPAIHEGSADQRVDARDKPGHDGLLGIELV